MLQLICLGDCVHVYDTVNRKYVKRNFTNVQKATSINQPQATRKKILKGVIWERCKDNSCKFQNCKQKGHWYPKGVITF
jgi:hypothetical protein